MRYLSLFSGIEACTVAWHPLGWEPAAFAEFDAFPSKVLAHHYPHVPNLGDVTKITDEQIQALGRIDIVVGGSPCQDLSVAGKRAGLAGARSSLFHEQWRIFDAARRLCGARWLLWENVPGAFSTHGGRDFAVVVNTLAGTRVPVPSDGWGTEGLVLGEQGLVEWCVLDAQWFGVAQRRRRLFVVLDTGDWTSRAPVLLEPESLRGDSAPSRGQREGVAGSVAHSLRAGGFDASEDGTGRGTPLVPAVTGALNHSGGHAVPGNCAQDWNAGMLIPEIANPLTARMHKGINSTCDEGQTMVAFAQNQRDEVRTMDVAGALAGEPGMKQQTFVATPAIAFDTYNQTVTGDTAQTLCSRGDTPGGNAHLVPAIAIRTANTSANGHGVAHEVAHTLDQAQGQAIAFTTEQTPKWNDDQALTLTKQSPTGGGQPQCVAFEEVADPIAANQGKTYTREGCNNFRMSNVAISFKPGSSAQARSIGAEEEVCPSLEAGGGGNNKPAVATAMQVRRLTPRECERLQGFPDNYTRIKVGLRSPEDCPDGPRYKALGNSMAVPVMRWIGRKLMEVTK